MDASLPKGNLRTAVELTPEAARAALIAEIKLSAGRGGPSAGYGIKVPKGDRPRSSQTPQRVRHES